MLALFNHTKPTLSLRQASIGFKFDRKLGKLDLSKRATYFLRMSHSAKGKKKKALLLGVGLDSDGHKRLTTGPNFALVGGSAETHEVMTEKAIKINERLSARGKSLEEVSAQEFDDIASSVGLHKHLPQGRENN